MKRYDRPTHPAVWFMTIIAGLVGLGIMMTVFDQAQQYVAGRNPGLSAGPYSTEGRAQQDR